MPRFLASILAMLGVGKPGRGGGEMADAYQGLRQQVLTLDPTTIGVKPDTGNRIWGVVVETGYPNGVATLVTLADGTVSLYFSKGGGTVGLGGHEGPLRASRALIAAAASYLGETALTSAFPLPDEGYTRFFLLTFDGVFTAAAKEEDLGMNRLPLSPLFHKAQDVITQARLTDDKITQKEGK
jgi:hypothetical protein